MVGVSRLLPGLSMRAVGGFRFRILGQCVAAMMSRSTVRLWSDRLPLAKK